MTTETTVAPATTPAAPESPASGAPAAASAAPATTAPASAAPVETDEQKRASGSQKRIDSLTREKWEERRLRQQTEEQLAAVRAELAAAKSTPSASTQAATAPAATNASADDLVNERASQLLKQREFNQRCNDVYNAGKTEIGADFQKAIDNFNVFGGLSKYPALVDAVTLLPEGHKVLAHLGGNLDEAGRILALPPIQQAIELTKISAQVRSSPVSHAPAPIVPLGGGSPNPDARPDDNGEFKTQEDFKAWRAKQFKKR